MPLGFLRLGEGRPHVALLVGLGVDAVGARARHALRHERVLLHGMAAVAGPHAEASPTRDRLELPDLPRRRRFGILRRPSPLGTAYRQIHAPAITPAIVRDFAEGYAQGRTVAQRKTVNTVSRQEYGLVPAGRRGAAQVDLGATHRVRPDAPAGGAQRGAAPARISRRQRHGQVRAAGSAATVARTSSLLETLSSAKAVRLVYWLDSAQPGTCLHRRIAVPQPQNDFDSPWKEALGLYLPQALEFLLPRVHAEVDWSHPPVFLGKELQQVAPRAARGLMLVDKLVRVWRLGVVEAWVLIHLEVQSQPDPAFAERMFSYNARILDRFRQPVVSVAILADERARWRPARYQTALWGCDVRFR